MALLFVDVDRFKVINDSFGHAAGDHVLRTIAERIQSALGDADEAARLGGDEFVIVQPDVHDVGAAVAVANRVRAAVLRPSARAALIRVCFIVYLRCRWIICLLWFAAAGSAGI